MYSINIVGEHINSNPCMYSTYASRLSVFDYAHFIKASKYSLANCGWMKG